MDDARNVKYEKEKHFSYIRSVCFYKKDKKFFYLFIYIYFFIYIPFFCDIRL